VAGVLGGELELADRLVEEPHLAVGDAQVEVGVVVRRRQMLGDPLLEAFDDLFQGLQEFDLTACGDFVVERRDGIASYQLAVVVDDAFQDVTRVVRGADLLNSTPWQLELQGALSLPRPIYGHLPLVVEPDGAKLSKSARSVPIDPAQVSEGLTSTLTLLSHQPPPELGRMPVREVWNWAFNNWRPQALVGKAQVRAPWPAKHQQIS